MPGPEKRLPGQSDADYARSSHVTNAQFLGTSSLHGGGDDLPLVRRVIGAVAALFRLLRRR